MNIKNRVLRWAYFVGLVYAFALYISLFFPGYMPADTVYMLSMGTGNEDISNFHPPLVTVAFGGMYRLFQHIGPLWLIQIGCYFAWVMVNARLYKTSFCCVAASIVFLAWPPIVTNMSTLMKDCWAVLVMLWLYVSLRKDPMIAPQQQAVKVVLLGLVGVVVRPDYFPVIVPFLCLHALRSAGLEVHRNRFQRMVAVTSVLMVAAMCVRVVSGVLVEKQVNAWAVTAVWDAAGARVCDPDNVDGMRVGEVNLTLDELRAVYSSATSDGLVFGLKLINLPQEELRRPAAEEVAECTALWWDAVARRTFGYVQHRLRVFGVFLGLTNKEVHGPYQFGIGPNPFGFEFKRTPNNIAAYWIFDSIAHGLLWRYWLYLCVATASGLMVCLLGRGYAVGNVVVLLMSIYAAAARGFVIPAADFRYGFWIMFGSLLIIFEAGDLLGDNIHRMLAIKLRRCDRVPSASRSSMA